MNVSYSPNSDGQNIELEVSLSQRTKDCFLEQAVHKEENCTLDSCIKELIQKIMVNESEANEKEYLLEGKKPI